MNHSSIVKWKSEGRFKSKRVESFAKKDFHKQYEVGDFYKTSCDGRFGSWEGQFN